MTNNTHEAAHTPGPWVFGNTGDGRRLILGGPNQRYVCSVQIHQAPRNMGLHDEPEREANANLILSAPTLAEEHRLLEEALRAVTEQMVELVNATEAGDRDRIRWAQRDAINRESQARAILEQIEARRKQ